MKNLPVKEQRILLFSVFVISLCGIIYELVLGSLATYLLGNPVQQYSITIGFFLSSMGVGSYLSRFLLKDLLKNFIRIEVFLGLAGGVSVIVLQYLFSFSMSFYFLQIFFLLIIGMLVGLEIPLLTRILKKYGSLKEIISNVLTLDYIGGLAGSLLFPLLLFPNIGRFLTSIVVGIVNVLVAVFVIAGVDYVKKRRSDYIFPGISAIFLIALAIYSNQISGVMQKRLYFDDVVFSKKTKYQEIVLTRSGDDFRLYLDGSIQFSTYDEYRYHEMLVYPALFANRDKLKDVLVLGGGDGLAVRDILKIKGVRSIVLVELDPEIINLARNNSSFKFINKDSLTDNRVKVVIDDAYSYLGKNRKKFNVIIADFPDPHDETITKLYTSEFYSMIKKTLAPGGVFVTQSTSPLFAREAFWCIYGTLKSVFKDVVPYHVYIPSFGEWGFNLAGMKIDSKGIEDIKPGENEFKFFSGPTFLSSLHFQKDCRIIPASINTFNRPLLYAYYLKGWKNVDL